MYLAQDTKLDRKVAIKFLAHEFSKDEDKLRRFIQEAKAASALNHPNILTVYEIGEVGSSTTVKEGHHYISTEFIDGKTLREQIKEKETVTLKNILKIGVQVAEALAAAHEAGIIHRDIKPENIMIRRDGYAKVLDFGLAKLSERRGDSLTGRIGDDEPTIALSPVHPITPSPVTSPGVVMGTVYYMSPEQARGQQTDARTDIWSLGVVLYELVAGRIPFSGETTSHTIVSILEKEPATLENAPVELTRIVRKALSKDVDMRYQSARDLLIDLKSLHRELDFQGQIEKSAAPNASSTIDAVSENKTRTFSPEVTHGQLASTKSTSSLEYAVTQAKSHKLATTIVALILVGVITTVVYFAFVAKRSDSSGGLKSIAVMPFVNASGNSEVEYLSDGITDSLIFRFSQLPNVKVSPTSSVMRFKKTTKEVTEIAKELEVDAVLSGRLMQVGDSLNISVQLIDARTNKLLWAEQYDRKMADLLATQREIATTLTQKMQLQLVGNERGLTKKYTSSNEAYQLYLRGRYHWSRRTRDDMFKAVDSYKQAIALDTNFALAYAALAEAYNSIGKNPDLPPKDCIPLAKAAATRALEIDPNLAQAHSALADAYSIYDWNWAEADKHFKKAIELDPNIAYTHLVYGGSYLQAIGKTDEALAEAKKAIQLEPLSLISNSVAVGLYLSARQSEQGLAQARTAYDLDPTFRLAHHWLGLALIANKKYDEAISISKSHLPSDAAADWMTLVVIAQAYAMQGKRTEAEQEISKLRELSKTIYIRPYYFAWFYAALGDKDKAFAELERSVEDRDCFLNRLTLDPFMDPLRDDPRFKEILKRMGLPL